MTGDFVRVVERYESLYCSYGAIRLQPPLNWKPTVKVPADEFLTIREQKLADLLYGRPFPQTKD